MSFFYVNKNTPLYKGISPSTESMANRSYRNRLLWLTRNSPGASRYGNVSKYVPQRRLKLLRLNYGTVRKLIKDPTTTNNLKKNLSLSWGFNLEGKNRKYINQYRNLWSDPALGVLMFTKIMPYLQTREIGRAHV